MHEPVPGRQRGCAWLLRRHDDDPSAVDSDFTRWLLAHDHAPDPSNGTMNCWEYVMVSAYRAGAVTENRLRAVYTLAAQRVRDGTHGTFGETFDEQFRAGQVVVYDHLHPATTPRPLRGDIVVFVTASNHMCIATGNIVQNAETGANECEVMSLWFQNHSRAVRITIEQLIREGAKTPVNFWSSNWS